MTHDCPASSCPFMHEAATVAVEALKAVAADGSLEPEHRIEAARAIVNFAITTLDIMHERRNCGCQHCEESRK